MATLEWDKLLNPQRFSHIYAEKKGTVVEKEPAPEWLINSRTEAERDHDRVVYASPVRRLGDKTQVFPLERNESVRNRLTHSHEVSNLARSIGVHLVNSGSLSKLDDKHKRDIPATLAAVGLAHDLGNPPFGHNGEAAIRSWIVKNSNMLFCAPEAGSGAFDPHKNEINSDLDKLSAAMKNDFYNFEGNAQTLRVLTRLQVVKDDLGLNLTVGTLSALMKYTIGSGSLGKIKDHVAAKKVGYFESEKFIAEEIFLQTGLSSGKRHPLTYIMEACDDIAYLIIDAEDSVKKQLASFSDLISWIESYDECNADPFTNWILDRSKKDYDDHRKNKLSSSELNDVSMQKFRVYAIHAMVSATINTFEKHHDQIMEADFGHDLIKKSPAAHFSKAIKEFDVLHGYRHRSVLELELDGFNALHELMDMLWRGITQRSKFTELGSKRTTPFTTYAYGRISENYRRIFEGTVLAHRPSEDLPIRYRELLLLTDMISGMTDSYALQLRNELARFNVGASAP